MLENMLNIVGVMMLVAFGLFMVLVILVILRTIFDVITGNL